ncbi:hypothetical protein E2562_030112 [Oryza meyeriana var. granulata]|uniref:Protein DETOXIFICATION n=1 Tax=Oryza meyeriana var. granulata TaxID=110450 RepID=A0A6G1BP24_9ORYZ|nr:hypothetical protein E2562_030112 [Oryza meyeriana var. granulata]
MAATATSPPMRPVAAALVLTPSPALNCISFTFSRRHFRSAAPRWRPTRCRERKPVVTDVVDDEERETSPEANTERKDAEDDVRGWLMLDDIGMDILRIALPAVLALTADPITALVDTAFVGYVGSTELAAVGVSISIFNLVSKLLNVPWLNVTTSFVAEQLAVDTAQMFSLHIGEEISSPQEKAREQRKFLPAVPTSLALAAGIGLMETVALIFGSGTLMDIIGIPVVRVSGAALATVTSEYLTAFILLWKLNNKIVLFSWTIIGGDVIRYLKSGALLIARTIAVVLTFTLLTSLAAREGSVPMAGYEICLQVWLTISLLNDALALAGQALLASEYAKGNYKKAHIVLYRVLQIRGITGVALATALFLGFGYLSLLFTDDPAVLDVAQTGVWFVAVSQLINAVAFVVDGLNYAPAYAAKPRRSAAHAARDLPAHAHTHALDGLADIVVQGKDAIAQKRGLFGLACGATFPNGCSQGFSANGIWRYTGACGLRPASTSSSTIPRPILHKNMLTVCMLCVKNRSVRAPAPRRSNAMASAAAASPPLLPTTVLPADTATATATAPTSVSSADANPATTRAFLARLLDSVKRALSGARPWPELIDRSALSRPESLSDATARLRKNLAYFRVNYAAIVALSLAVSLLAHPFSLAALLALLAAWCFLYLLRPADAPPLAAFGRTFSDRETLGGLIVASAFVVFLTSVGSLIFSALALGAALVCAHGAFRVPEDLFLDEPDQANGGASVNLLSFISNATGGRV